MTSDEVVDKLEVTTHILKAIELEKKYNYKYEVVVVHLENDVILGVTNGMDSSNGNMRVEIYNPKKKRWDNISINTTYVHHMSYINHPLPCSGYNCPRCKSLMG